MADSPTSPDPRAAEPEKKSVGGDLIIPIAGIAFTLYYFSTIINSPWTAQVSAFFIGAVLIVLVAIFIIKTAVELSSGEADLRLGNLTAPRAFIPKRLALLGLTLGYIITVQWGGFTLTTFAFMTLAMMLLTGGKRKRFIVVLCASTALAGYALFILAFDTRFPAGPFERLMETMITVDRSL